jgi:hypothetical protein
MKAMLFAVIAIAFFPSYGQKFPKVVSSVPKLSSEVPKIGICPAMPKSWSDAYPITRVFNTLESFLQFLRTEVYDGPINVSWRPGCVKEHGNRVYRCNAPNVAEAICRAMARYQVEWVLKDVSDGVLLVVRPSCSCCLHK